MRLVKLRLVKFGLEPISKEVKFARLDRLTESKFILERRFRVLRLLRFDTNLRSVKLHSDRFKEVILSVKSTEANFGLELRSNVVKLERLDKSIEAKVVLDRYSLAKLLRPDTKSIFARLH